MDNQRLFLYAGLLFLALLIWQQWELDYGAKPPPPPPQAVDDGAPAPPADVAAPAPMPEDVPDEPPVVAVPETPAIAGSEQLPAAGSVTVTTDVLRLQIDLRGGGIRKAELLDYPVTVKEPDNPIALLDDDPRFLFIAQSGLQSSGQDAPTHRQLGCRLRFGSSFRFAEHDHRRRLMTGCQGHGRPVGCRAAMSSRQPDSGQAGRRRDADRRPNPQLYACRDQPGQPDGDRNYHQR